MDATELKNEAAPASRVEMRSAVQAEEVMPPNKLRKVLEEGLGPDIIESYSSDLPYGHEKRKIIRVAMVDIELKSIDPETAEESSRGASMFAARSRG